MTTRPKKGQGSKAKLREYFLANVGVVLNSKELFEVSGGANEFARRIRELKNEEGMNIVTHNDRDELSIGQYLLVDLKPMPFFERGISKKVRALVLDRNGFTCQMCGIAAGEINVDTGKKARLHIGHITDKSMGGDDDPGNLRALCSDCNEGASNLTLNRPDAIKLLAHIRRAPKGDQLDILKWAMTKYKKETQEFYKALYD